MIHCSFENKLSLLFLSNMSISFEGIPVGTHWETRMGCSADGVHR